MKIRLFKQNKLARFIKSFFPSTLYGRALIIIIAPIILVQTISGYIFFERHWDSITRQLSSELASKISALISLYDEKYPTLDPVAVRNFAGEHFSLFVTFESEGKIEKEDPKPTNETLRKFVLRNFFKENFWENFLITSLAQRLIQPFKVVMDHTTIYVDVQVRDGIFHFETSRKRIFNRTTFIFLMWSLGTTILFLTIALAFMRNQIRPLRRLAKAAENFGKGRDAPNFRPEGALEVRKASTAFIVMQQRIKRQLAQRTEMLAGVSHDLRTPLTRLKLQLAMIPKSQEIEDLKRDVLDMERMVEDYLAFARDEGLEAPKELNISKIIREITDTLAKTKTCVIKLPKTLNLMVRPNSFRRAITNLVGNACKYAQEISISYVEHPYSLEIIIDDNGPGIPKEKREEVFKPFTRLDKARNKDAGGSGLGLTIARDIIRSHGGEVLLNTSPQNGLRVSVIIPT